MGLLLGFSLAGGGCSPGPAPGLPVVVLSIWLALPGLLPFPGGRRLLWWGGRLQLGLPGSTAMGPLRV